MMLNTWTWAADGFPALAGGLLIGLSAAGLFWLLGRIAGISGMLGAVIFERSGRALQVPALFLAGLFAAGLVAYQGGVAAKPVIDAGMPQVLIAGLLVGFGTRLGSGCTSGHGVCGMARLSPRSLAATAVFMAVGFVTVYFLFHGAA